MPKCRLKRTPRYRADSPVSSLRSSSLNWGLPRCAWAYFATRSIRQSGFGSTCKSILQRRAVSTCRYREVVGSAVTTWARPLGSWPLREPTSRFPPIYGRYKSEECWSNIYIGRLPLLVVRAIT
jgi:hypothetical protein